MLVPRSIPEPRANPAGIPFPSPVSPLSTDGSHGLAGLRRTDWKRRRHCRGAGNSNNEMGKRKDEYEMKSCRARALPSRRVSRGDQESGVFPWPTQTHTNARARETDATHNGIWFRVNIGPLLPTKCMLTPHARQHLHKDAHCGTADRTPLTPAFPLSRPTVGVSPRHALPESTFIPQSRQPFTAT